MIQIFHDTFLDMNQLAGRVLCLNDHFGITINTIERALYVCRVCVCSKKPKKGGFLKKLQIQKQGVNVKCSIVFTQRFLAKLLAHRQQHRQQHQQQHRQQHRQWRWHQHQKRVCSVICCGSCSRVACYPYCVVDCACARPLLRDLCYGLLPRLLKYIWALSGAVTICHCTGNVSLF